MAGSFCGTARTGGIAILDFRSSHIGCQKESDSIMSISETKNRIAIPTTLVAQLSEFRKRVWTIKMLEATGIALFSIFFGVL